MEIELFDALARARAVEEVVMRDQARAYYRFRRTRFYGGCATADAVGCNLLCAYCWNFQRNSNAKEAATEFFTPEEVAEKLVNLARRDDAYRISGCEPILGDRSAAHLRDVIQDVLRRKKYAIRDPFFIIETNGIMLGAQPHLIQIFKEIPRENLLFRISIKADSPERFERITNAERGAFEFQKNAVRELKKANRIVRVAYMPEIVSKDYITKEFANVISTVENLKFYNETKKRLRERGIALA